jgi:hypothetical protein
LDDASLIALRFAYRLTDSRDAARELAARTNLRLVEQGRRERPPAFMPGLVR